jgi:hypothetical protein
MLNSPSFEFGGVGAAGTGLPVAELDAFLGVVFRMVVSCLKRDKMPF